MHEMSIVQSMLETALEQAGQHQAKRITRFNIEVSALADESEDSLRFYFESLGAGTLAEGAQVDIVRVPVQARCFDCGHRFSVDAEMHACPNCGSLRLELLAADEFKLVSIDIE